jgi:hypothetical protein
MITSNSNEEPNTTDLARPWRKRRAWFWGEIAYGRLFREYESTRAEIRSLASRNNQGDSDWHHLAEAHLEIVERSLQCRDIEGGWAALHASRRASVWGLATDEIQHRVIVLREECQKLTHWRNSAVMKLLGGSTSPVSADCLILSMEIRDEDAANRYHKIWLQGEQLGVLCFLVAMALMLFLVVVPVIFSWRHGWSCVFADQSTVPKVALFGVLGAAFSAAQSLIGFPSNARIPERVANQFVTVSRTLFGSISAVAGYEFLQSGIIRIPIGPNDNTSASISLALAIAFLFGYAGERLVAGVANSVTKRDSEKNSS